MNEVKSRLHESKTETEKILEEEVKNFESMVRKMQEDMNKYEIANRMLLKRAEEAEKFKDSHKNCTS